MAAVFKKLFKSSKKALELKKPKDSISIIQNAKPVITNPKQIKNIKRVFVNTKKAIDSLKKIKDPVKEKKLRIKILSAFERNIKKQDFAISFQKLDGLEKPAMHMFLEILSQDYLNFSNKKERESILTQLIREDIIFRLSKDTNRQMTEKFNNYYGIVEKFVYDKITFTELKSYKAKTPEQIRIAISKFFKSNYLQYKQQVIEYLNKDGNVNSDVIRNALINLEYRIEAL